MPRHRFVAISLFTFLATAIAFGSVNFPMTQGQFTGTNAFTEEELAAVIPDHRENVTSNISAIPRYTIAATFLPPSAGSSAVSAIASEESSESQQATPVASPHATPVALLATPRSATPVASPEATSIAAPHATPVASPEATPIASPHATPAGGTGAVDEPDTPAPEGRTEPRIIGSLDLDYINTTGNVLHELPLRLYPNLPQYGNGEMIVDNVFVDGRSVEVLAPALHSAPDATPVPIDKPGERGLALVRIPLQAPLEPGDGTTVRMDFSTTVPIDPPDENGLFRYSPETATWTLAHWFPMLAGFDPVHGWDIAPPASWSDITFSNTALFDIILSAPDDLVVVTTGVEVSTEGDGPYRTTRISTGPVRDVAILAEPGLVSTDTKVGETTITSWHRPGEDEGAEKILQWVAQSFEVYTDMFGPYPYTTLDIVPVPYVIGYEFPQLVFIGDTYYADPETAGSRPGAIEFLVAHEVAHQWWYGLVGSNPHQHAFLDEGLTEYSTILYFERQYGDEVAASHLRDGLIHRYALMLATAGDQVADQPTTNFPDLGTYYATVYRKAGLGFEAIRHEIGDEAFLAGLRHYAETMLFGVASPDDLRTIFETISGQDLTTLWTLWFETDQGRIEIEMDPLPGTPGPATPGTPQATPLGTPVSATPVDADLAATPARATPMPPDATPNPTVSSSPSASPVWTTLITSPSAATPNA